MITCTCVLVVYSVAFQAIYYNTYRATVTWFSGGRYHLNTLQVIN